ncbi:MAG TPA: acyclic terpene utilization AtuA family protein [Vicinamibacterales bacterium]|nr:acyclic terpene utilization AtuA family protein [Vicinamibacterales bacterium]
MTASIRIGCGAGYSGDRIEPAVELAEQGRLDYLVFECLAERTIALAQLRKAHDPAAGYDPLLAERMRAVLPACAAGGVTIVTNMGAANPAAAAAVVRGVARELGLAGLPVAAITGDDVLDVVTGGGFTIDETGAPVESLGDALVSANAYIGAAPIVEALGQGARVVVTGRAADPSLFVGPLRHAFGWTADDWPLLGRATAVGHLLECAGQVTGGYFADPGRTDVAGLARLGFPIAEVAADGRAVVTKVPGSGGAVTIATCSEQLLYEIGDPAAYVTPDVVADFSGVELALDGADRVRVRGATGHPAPPTLKVALGHRDGFIGDGQISYGGSGAIARARLAATIVTERLRIVGVRPDALRCDLIGLTPCTARPDRASIRNRTKCGCAWRRGHGRAPRRIASAGRSRRSIRTGRTAAAAPPPPPARCWRLPRPGCRAIVSAAASRWRWPDMRLRDVAHGRAGDKGRRVNLSVIAFDPADYPRLAREVTADRVRAHLADLIAGPVIRYELPQLAALNFVLERPAGGGVTETLALDPHGKSLSAALLDLEIS